ncbi:hypothetical protein BgAZ_305880 [Babesia gibsoni]|uniref:Uncharacterized protein n=1 Tax=Babesia gibsoni TaxID=33632 RepID=A0AAD8P918_BABGI|nr:hypothetical protein BgAZ_305880 [Babesia gibsoni]
MSHGRKPGSAWNGEYRNHISGKRHVNHPHAVALPRTVTSVVDKVKGVVTFYRELTSVPLYIVTDELGNPLISQYPTINKGWEMTQVCPVSVKDRVRVLPNSTQLVEQFMKLFQDKKATADTVSNDMETTSGRMRRGMLYFMDPNACSTHIMELRKQGKEAFMDIVPMSYFARQATNVDREYEHIMLPFDSSLTHATYYGNGTFKGTPVFTTDPPIVMTTEENADDDFNPETDKFVVFFTPDEAKSFFRRAWWSRRTTVENDGDTEHYKIIGSYTSPSPTVRYTNLEKIGAMISCKEPYWGLFIHVMPPTVVLDSNATELIEEYEQRKASLLLMLRKIAAYMRHHLGPQLQRCGQMVGRMLTRISEYKVQF